MRPESRSRITIVRQIGLAMLNVALLPIAMAHGFDGSSPSPARAEESRSVSDSPGRNADRASREAILASPTWRQTIAAFDEWLSDQPIYSDDVVERFKLDRARRLASMSADELDEFARELDEKLSLVSSPEWIETVDWIRETLAIATPAYARKLNLQYPDVLRLSSAQLRSQLKTLERRHAAARRQAQAFERLRDERMALHQRELQAQAEARERALDRAAMSNRFAAYHPAHTATQRTRRPFYPPMMPFAFGFGMGFGFW